MSNAVQMVIVIVAVALAVLFVVRRLVKGAKGEDYSCCSSPAARAPGAAAGKEDFCGGRCSGCSGCYHSGSHQ